MEESNKYEKLRAYIDQQITDINNNTESGGDAAKLAKQIQLHFLYQLSDKMRQLDDDELKEL